MSGDHRRSHSKSVLQVRPEAGLVQDAKQSEDYPSLTWPCFCGSLLLFPNQRLHPLGEGTLSVLFTAVSQAPNTSLSMNRCSWMLNEEDLGR